MEKGGLFGKDLKKCFVIVALRRSLSMFDRWIEVSPRHCLGWLLKHRWPETKTECIILHGYKKNLVRKTEPISKFHGHVFGYDSTARKCE